MKFYFVCCIADWRYNETCNTPKSKILKSNTADGRHAEEYIFGYNLIHSGLSDLREILYEDAYNRRLKFLNFKIYDGWRICIATLRTKMLQC